MDKRKELIMQFVNFKLDNLLSELKMEIENAFKKDFYLKEEEIEPLIKKIFSQQTPSTSNTSIDILYDLNQSLKASVSQKELIEVFFNTLSTLTDYIGFFIFKGNNAICYAAKGKGEKPQRDYKMSKIIFLETKKISDNAIPEEFRAFFNPETTILVPLLIKFKQAGFFVFELQNEEESKLVEIATSMFERELNLLPLKTQEEIKTQHFKQQEKPAPSQPQKTGEMDAELKKARRFANALASDIKLYNEDKVKEGLEKGNLKELLKEDIEKSYEAFRERYPDKERFPDSIFEEALIKYVAKGNASLLK